MKVGVIKVADFLNPRKENVNYAEIGVGKNQVDWLYKSGRPPLAWHSYAAATNGFVYLYDESFLSPKMFNCDLAIVTVDKYIAPLDFVTKSLKSKGIPVVYGMHEGLQTIQRLPLLSGNPKIFQSIRNIAAKNNITGWIDPMPQQMKTFFELYSKTASPEFKVYSIPSAWPLHVSEHFTIPEKNRKGIMIGASDFGNFTLRNTMIDFVIAAYISNELDIPVTLIMGHNSQTCSLFTKAYKQWFKNTNNLNVITSKMPYVKWLNLLAKHKICINVDMSLSQGQVVGDCALVGVPCIGGNSTIQGLIYPSLAFDTINLDEVYASAINLCKHDDIYHAVCRSSNINALSAISFERTAKNLKRIYDDQS